MVHYRQSDSLSLVFLVLWVGWAFGPLTDEVFRLDILRTSGGHWHVYPRLSVPLQLGLHGCRVDLEWIFFPLKVDSQVLCHCSLHEMSNLRVLVDWHGDTSIQSQRRKPGSSTQKNQTTSGKNVSKFGVDLVWILAWILRGFFGDWGAEKLHEKSTPKSGKKIPRHQNEKSGPESVPQS